ncbi:hypothetical protein H4R19_001069 [Coemansia spiralis]|nr:hypothetical protein H4R19_001069 [Coemansia spiralis]
MPDRRHYPAVRETSIFYRRPPPTASPAAPAPAQHPDDCSCPDAACHNNGYEPSCDDEAGNNNDLYSYCDTGSSSAADDDTDPAEAAAATEAACRFAACQELPYSHCFFTPDTHEFLWTVTEANETRPATAVAPAANFALTKKSYWPPTPEIVRVLAESLHRFCRNDICRALVPHGKRHPPLTDFIWCVFDNTQTDMWTALSCILLLRRFRTRQPACDNAPYEAPYSLFLGIFMAAIIHCEQAITPEHLHPSSIAQMLDSWYQVPHLVAIRYDTLAKLGFRSWISLHDILHHVESNLYDIHDLESSLEHYEERQRQRREKEALELQKAEEMKRKQASYLRYMYRSPHDTLCSWNRKISYITEDRFHFRHLPWSPGANAPIHLTARCEEIREYLEDNRAPVFSPLLPALRPIVPSSTH